MKIIFILSISLCLSQSVWAQSTAANCKATLKDENTRDGISAELNINGRHITLVGWTHPGADDFNALIEALPALQKEGAAGNCPAIKKIIGKALIDSGTKLETRANAMIQKLKEINAKNKIDHIGVELSEFENKKDVASTEQWRPIISELAKKCPDLKNPVERFKNLFSGPQDTFARSQASNINIEGVESLYLRNQSLKSLSDDANFFFGGQGGLFELSPATLALVGPLVDIVDSKGLPMPEKGIQEVVAAEPNKALGQRLGNALRDLNSIITLVPRRNEMIASSLLNREGNYAVTLGAEHIKEIALIMEKKCLEMAQRPKKEEQQHFVPIEH